MIGFGSGVGFGSGFGVDGWMAGGYDGRVQLSPLVGRNEEVAMLRARLHSPTSAGFLLAGRPGVGKTRLVRELAADEETRGRVVRRVVAVDDATDLPFAAIGHLVPGTAFEHGAEGVTHALIAALASDSGDSPAADRPLLVVDDVHLLDPASALALLRVVEAKVATVMLTLRSGEPVPASVVALWKDDLIERVDLLALSVSEVGEMAGHLTGARVDPATALRLWEITEGNPLFVREVVRSAFQPDHVVHGVWAWRSSLQPDGQLIDTVSANLDRVTRPVREVLTALTVGQPLALATIAALSSSEAVADAEHAVLVTVDDHDDVRLAHPLYREVMLAVTSRADQQRWRRRLAMEAVSNIDPNTEGPPKEPLRIGRWCLELREGDVPVADRPRVCALLEAAAAVANHLADYSLGYRLAEQAINLGGYDGVGRAAVLLSLAVDATLEPAAARARMGELRHRTDLTDETRTKLGLRDLFGWLWGMQQPMEASRVAGLWAETVSDPALREVLHASGAVAGFFGGDTNAGAELDRVLAGDVPLARLGAFEAAGLRGVLEGRPQWTLDTAASLTGAMLAHLGWHDGVMFAVANPQASALIMTARLDEADRLIDLVDMLVTYADDEIRSLIAGGRGFLALQRGAVSTALDLLSQSLAVGSTSSRNWRRSLPLAAMAEAAALAGEPLRARRALEEACVALPAVFVPAQPYIERAQAWVEWSEGSTAAAVVTLVGSAARCRERGWSGMEVTLLYDAIRLGAVHDVSDRLLAIEVDETPFWDLKKRTVGALRRGDGASLVDLLDEWSAFGMVLRTAEVAIWAAELLRRSGRLAEASAARARAESWLAMCEGSRSPVAIAYPSGPVVALTRREREIAFVAAAGKSNREIAEELNVSVRTVEGHLLRVYAKLGVNDRAGLSAVLGSSQNA